MLNARYAVGFDARAIVRFIGASAVRSSTMRAASMLWGTGLVLVLALAATGAFAHEGDGQHAHGHGDAHQPVLYEFDQDRDTPHAPHVDEDGYAWWKGNLHTHTLWSDGDEYPEIIVDWYVQHGYHFLALSDHNRLQRGQRWINPVTNRFAQRTGGLEGLARYKERFGGHWVETRQNDDGETLVRLKPLDEFRHLFERAGEFLMIEAEEITSNLVHVNAANIVERTPFQRGNTVEEHIRNNINAVLEQGERHGRITMPHLNHPNFKWAVRAEDMVPVENLQFFEVYNGHRSVRNYGDDIHVGLDRMWDIVLTLRLAEQDLGVVYGLAVDDAHSYEHSTSEHARPGRGWVMVRSRFLTPEHLIKAMQRGDFYATTGVTLRRIERSGSAVRIEIEPEEGVSFTTRFIGTRAAYAPDREPRLDADGEPLDVTKRYSEDIGEVLAEVEGNEAAYEFEGDEIYVRAHITSSKPKENPHRRGEPEQAWVQPVIPR